MTREESIRLSSAISELIRNRSPKIEYSKDSLNKARQEFSDKALKSYGELGLYRGDFEEFFVFKEFCSLLGIDQLEDGEYMASLLMQARKFDDSFIKDDPYVKAVKFSNQQQGNISLTHSSYAPGEIFCYDMPDFSKKLVVPKLGFFNKQVTFPTVYEGDMPWMSICPSEINSLQRCISPVYGNVLVLGLGLGYYPFIISPRAEKITIVELSENIIDIFEKFILPNFPQKEKISVVHGDAIEFLKNANNGDFDFCFADIWEGAVDGAPLYLQIKQQEKRLNEIKFDYWIEAEIKEYIQKDL